MGLQGGGILQQSSNMAIPDSRIYAFFGILAAVLIVIDGAAQLAHSQIQIQAIVFNRVSGVVIGVLTAFLLSILGTFELNAAANPIGGRPLDRGQRRAPNAGRGPALAVPLLD